MKDLKEIFLIGIIVLLCVIFLISNIIDLKQLGLCSKVLIFPFLLLYYAVKTKEKKLFFSLFLVFFALAEFSQFLILNMDFYNKYGPIASYVDSSLYIISYVSLLILIVSDIKIKPLFKRFSLHAIVLSLFGLYLLYAFDNMLKYHGLASMSTIEYVLATTYNLLIILILISSLLSYLYHDNRKSLILFIVCLCIVFSELVQTAYYFMAREKLLSMVSTILLSIGFFALIVYLVHENKSKSIIEEEDFLSNARIKDA